MKMERLSCLFWTIKLTVYLFGTFPKPPRTKWYKSPRPPRSGKLQIHGGLDTPHSPLMIVFHLIGMLFHVFSSKRIPVKDWYIHQWIAIVSPIWSVKKKSPWQYSARSSELPGGMIRGSSSQLSRTEMWLRASSLGPVGTNSNFFHFLWDIMGVEIRYSTDRACQKYHLSRLCWRVGYPMCWCQC